MMRLLLACLAVIFFTVFAHAQSTEDLIRQQSREIRSIVTSDTDYTDLQSLASSIGNARIVILGEMDNGDGETLKAKTRLVKYLHQKLGFTVLAFESDFNGVNWIWETRKNGYAALQAVTHIWTDVAEFKDMEKYIELYAHGPNPLIVSGIDCQVYDVEQVENFMLRVPKLFAALGYDTKDPAYWNYVTSLVRANDYDSAKRLPDTTITFLRNFTSKVMTDLKAHPELDSTGLWKQTFSNFMGNAANCWLNRKVPVGYNFLQLKHDGTIHDRQMADNLRWLADERYKDRKIIVWAQNRHVTKNIDQIEVDISNYRRIQNTTMGNEVFKKFGNDVFIIGFTSSEGTSGSPFQRNGRPYEVKPLSKKDFYTNVMQDLKFNYAFTDFRAIQKTDAASKAFVMRGWGYEFDMRGNWFNAFDGVFYIKSNKAATVLTME
jgi:erythromycin esterase-like protein